MQKNNQTKWFHIKQPHIYMHKQCLLINMAKSEKITRDMINYKLNNNLTIHMNLT